MKSKILALVAIAAMSLTCACSDDETEETLTEKCQKGDAAACLIGMWQMQSIQDAGADYAIVADFRDGPGRLVINEDGSFTYTYATSPSSLMVNDCGGLDDSGKWTYDDATKTLSLKFTVGEQCNPSPTASAIVSVNTAELTLSGHVFQSSEDVSSSAQLVEYFRRIAVLQ